jgi:hypothetical protein
MNNDTHIVPCGRVACYVNVSTKAPLVLERGFITMKFGSYGFNPFNALLSIQVKNAFAIGELN